MTAVTIFRLGRITPSGNMEAEPLIKFPVIILNALLASYGLDDDRLTDRLPIPSIPLIIPLRSNPCKSEYPDCCCYRDLVERIVGKLKQQG